MRKVWLIALICRVWSVEPDPSFKFEGILGAAVENINNMNKNAQAFIPYNPIIVEIGAYEGAGTIGLATNYPYARIFAFEPNPKAYALLLEKIGSAKNVSAFNLAVNVSNGMATLYGDGAAASLRPLQNGKNSIHVPCIVLDDWCKHNGIDRIDFLRLDAGGLEWKIVQSSPEILKSVLVIVTKTYMRPAHKSIPSYHKLKNLLENEGFALLSHWYQEGHEGEATFVRKYIYDAVFR